MALTSTVKTLFLCSLSGLLAAVATAVVGHELLDAELTTQALSQVANSSTLLGSRVGDELRSISERARFYASFPQSAPESALAHDDRFIALRILKRQPAETAIDWVESFRWTRPLSDPLHLDEAAFQDLELKHPLDLDQVGEGVPQLAFGSARNRSSMLRLAIPFGDQGPAAAYDRVLVAELSSQWLNALFSEARGQFSFLVNSDGHLLTASESGHFQSGDDLSALAAIRTATASVPPSGALDYSETPEGALQYAGFFKNALGAPGHLTHLTVVTQIPRTAVTQALDSYLQTSTLAALGFAVISGILALFLGQLFPGPPVADAPPEATDWREAEQGLVIKFRSPELKARFESEQILLQGERKSAMVLHIHLNGIDAISKQADPEQFLGILNRFNESVTVIVEAQGGFVDHVHGGSIVACWGIPFSLDHDADRAVKAALAVRGAAHSLNVEFTKQDWPSISLGMGMHYGSVIAGQVGSPGRLEYSAVGDAIETSSRIPGYTDQFGTDFLITGAAVGQLSIQYTTERVATGDDGTPELYELILEQAHAA